MFVFTNLIILAVSASTGEDPLTETNEDGDITAPSGDDSSTGMYDDCVVPYRNEDSNYSTNTAGKFRQVV